MSLYRDLELINVGVLGDIFLGPKISFASASANRKEGERSVSEELKEKIERAGRDRSFRDRNGDRHSNRTDQQSQVNGHTENGQRRLQTRRGSGGEGDRQRIKARQRQVDSEEHEELPTPRRVGLPEKLHKSWFRDGNDQENQKTFSDNNARGHPHDRVGKENRHEHKPSWMGDPLAQEEEETEAQTQQDFAAWKEMMKKGHATKDSVAKTPVADEPQPGTITSGLTDALISPAADQPLFGTYGESQAEERKTDESKKVSKPAKVSRFFGGGAPKQQQEQVASESPKASPQPNDPEEDENKRGFQNILQMLRTGGNVSQEQSESAFAPPTLQLPLHSRNPTSPSNNPPPNTDLLMHSPHERAEPTSPRHRAQVSQPLPQKQPPPSRDAEFLINLMKQQQPRPPFQEGQIYGQNYNQRREPDDIASLINGASPLPAKHRGPPPSFLDNQRAFAHNSSIDVPSREPPRDKPPDESFGHLHMRPNEAHQHTHGLPDFRFPLQQPHDFGPSNAGRQQRPPSGEGIPPPPGFGVRPGIPPGFPPFGHSQNGPPHQGGPPQVRGPPPMHFNGLPPPGFGPQPPPGIGPQHNGRRMPSGNVPPGFEMYGDLQRRGPPPPPQSSYTQYLKQGGGPAAY